MKYNRNKIMKYNSDNKLYIAEYLGSTKEKPKMNYDCMSNYQNIEDEPQMQARVLL